MTIEKKLEVLNRYDRGEKTSVIVHATGLNESTLRTIRAAASRPTAPTPEPERMLTKSDLEEALSSIRGALDILEAKDPNINRSATIARKVMSELNCYTVMLEQKKKKTTQTKLSQFFIKKTVLVEGREKAEGREQGEKREWDEEGHSSEEGEGDELGDLSEADHSGDE